jgi:hypothetical protein
MFIFLPPEFKVLTSTLVSGVCVCDSAVALAHSVCADKATMVPDGARAALLPACRAEPQRARSSNAEGARSKH